MKLSASIIAAAILAASAAQVIATPVLANEGALKKKEALRNGYETRLYRALQARAVNTELEEVENVAQATVNNVKSADSTTAAGSASEIQALDDGKLDASKMVRSKSDVGKLDGGREIRAVDDGKLDAGKLFRSKSDGGKLYADYLDTVAKPRTHVGSTTSADVRGVDARHQAPLGYTATNAHVPQHLIGNSNLHAQVPYGQAVLAHPPGQELTIVDKLNPEYLKTKAHEVIGQSKELWKKEGKPRWDDGKRAAKDGWNRRIKEPLSKYGPKIKEHVKMMFEPKPKNSNTNKHKNSKTSTEETHEENNGFSWNCLGKGCSKWLESPPASPPRRAWPDYSTMAPHERINAYLANDDPGCFGFNCNVSCPDGGCLFDSGDAGGGD